MPTLSSPAELSSDWYFESSWRASLASMSSTLWASSASTWTEESSLTVTEPLETKNLISLPSFSTTWTTPGLRTAGRAENRGITRWYNQVVTPTRDWPLTQSGHVLGQDAKGAGEGGHIDLAHHGGIVEGLVGGGEGELHLVRVAPVLGQTGAAGGQQTGVLHEGHSGL